MSRSNSIIFITIIIYLHQFKNNDETVFCIHLWCISAFHVWRQMQVILTLFSNCCCLIISFFFCCSLSLIFSNIKQMVPYISPRKCNMLCTLYEFVTIDGYHGLQFCGFRHFLCVWHRFFFCFCLCSQFDYVCSIF